jgi:hypothetical protein
MATIEKKMTAAEIKKAIIAGRSGEKKEKLTAIARSVGLAYNTEFVPWCEKNAKEIFKELGEPLPKQLGAKEGTRRMSDKVKAVSPKLLVQTILESGGKMTAKELADKLNMRLNGFNKQYSELKAKGVKLPALPDGELAETDIDELNALILDSEAKTE